LSKAQRRIAPLAVFRDLDKLGLLNNVPTLNFHPHLPHYKLTTKDTQSVHLLARQPIDPDRPHPFTAGGNTEFNSLIVCSGCRQISSVPKTSCMDSTNFTTLFGGTDSLRTSGGILP
jgi:hypothetical protein